MLKQFKNYNISSDMFRFTQEPKHVGASVIIFKLF